MVVHTTEMNGIVDMRFRPSWAMWYGMDYGYVIVLILQLFQLLLLKQGNETITDTSTRQCVDEGCMRPSVYQQSLHQITPMSYTQHKRCHRWQQRTC